MATDATPPRLDGALGFARVDEVLARTPEILAAGMLDLSRVSTIDSAGVSLLLELTRRAQSAGQSLAIRGASPQVRALAAFFKVEPLLRFDN